MINKENNYAFIDSQNLNLSIRELGWRIDFARFRVFLKEKYGINKAFVFIGYMQKNDDLYAKLKEDGYSIVFKPIVQNHPDGIKGNVDAELVLHTMIEYKNYDRAIIVSGDGDFSCLIKYLYVNNKLKKLIIPNRRKYSKLLRSVLPDKKKFLFLNTFSDKLRSRHKTPPAKTDGACRES